MRVGPGPYNEIGIHRVVRESAPNAPVRGDCAVFLAHGDIWNFRAAFLTGAHPLPVFLAENGIDVWGINYRWTFIPGDLADYSFLANWGIEQDADDLAYARRRRSEGRLARLPRLHESPGRAPRVRVEQSRGRAVRAKTPPVK